MKYYYMDGVVLITEIVNIDMISPNTTMYRQSTILLYCVAYGFPVAPSITWKFNGNSVLHDNVSKQFLFVDFGIINHTQYYLQNIAILFNALTHIFKVIPHNCMY